MNGDIPTHFFFFFLLFFYLFCFVECWNLHLIKYESDDIAIQQNNKKKKKKQAEIFPTQSLLSIWKFKKAFLVIIKFTGIFLWVL